MNCPKCGSADTSVRDSRQAGPARYRRRRCKACGKRFGTMEIPMQEYIRLKADEAAIESIQEVQP